MKQRFIVKIDGQERASFDLRRLADEFVRAMGGVVEVVEVPDDEESETTQRVTQ
jgi:hypothetical protein